jgi:hypothetical protein
MPKNMESVKKKGPLNSLLNMFGVSLVKASKNGSINNDTKIIRPGKKENDPKKFDGVVKPINFPTDVEKAYQYYLSNYNLYNSNRERASRYKECEFMTRNDGIMACATQIYAEESFETKDGQKPIQIKAKDRKLEKYFYEWMDKIGLGSNQLRDIAYNLVIYGDAFWLNAIDLAKGVTGITIVDPYQIRDKLEFNLNTVGNIREWEVTSQILTNKFKTLQQVADLIDGEAKNEDYSLYYQTYCLGYELKFGVDTEDNYKALPPWAVTHARLYTSKNEFFPFGRPLFINSLARFKSYRTTEMLIDMLRAASFPKEHIKIKGGDTLTPLDRMKRVDEVRMILENITPATNTKDNIGIGERIYSIDDLFEFDIVNSEIDIETLGDLEAKMNDLILSTGIPDSYLIPSRGAGLGGENASSLYYNNKIFQRRVESVQMAMLEAIDQTFRIDLEITGQGNGEFSEFEVFIPVNADMYASDKISKDSDMLSLATEMLNNLGQALGMDRGEPIPEPVVRDIFKYYLPIDEDLLDKWINKIVKKEEENDENGAGGADPNNVAAPLIMKTDSTPSVAQQPVGKGRRESLNSSLKVKRFYEKYNNDLVDKTLREVYFSTKKEKGQLEGLRGKYMYYNNSYRVKENMEKSGNKYSIYSLLRGEVLEDKRRRIEEKGN